MDGYGDTRLLISEERHDGLTQEVRSYPIFRVPSILRNNAPHMFSPRVVPMGPLHDPEFNTMFSSTIAPDLASTYYEMNTLKHLAEQAIFHKNPSAKHEYEAFLNENKESMISQSYGIFLDPEYVETRFVPRLASDACFIAAILNSLFQENLRFLRSSMYETDLILVELAKRAHTASFFHPLFIKKVSRPEQKAILEDIVMLVENQIPLVAVRRAVRIDCKCGRDDDAERLIELYVAALAHRILPFSKSKKNVFGSLRDATLGGEHLLDIMYSIVCMHTNHLLPYDQSKKSHDDHECVTYDPHIRDMPGATRLYMSGVRFHGHWGGLNEITFKTGQLSLPKIHVGDDTEMYFRNLIAYESGFKMDRLEIISYLHFMDFLIDSPNDVELLVENKIITETIGSNEKVAEMWNRLCRNTMCVFSLKYKTVAEELKTHCKSPWRVMWAEFYRSKLSRPWLVISLLSAAALLIMTFFILWYTILLYRHDTKSRE